MPLPLTAKILILAVGLAVVVAAIVYYKDIVRWFRHRNLRDINLPIGPEVVDQLTYEEAFNYFVGDRPADARIVKGAMLLEEDPKGRLLTQVFLDKNDNLVADPNRKPYGRRLVVRSLDAELQETFGDKDLVIVE